MYVYTACVTSRFCFTYCYLPDFFFLGHGCCFGCCRFAHEQAFPASIPDRGRRGHGRLGGKTRGVPPGSLQIPQDQLGEVSGRHGQHRGGYTYVVYIICTHHRRVAGRIRVSADNIEVGKLCVCRYRCRVAGRVRVGVDLRAFCATCFFFRLACLGCAGCVGGRTRVGVDLRALCPRYINLLLVYCVRLGCAGRDLTCVVLLDWILVFCGVHTCTRCGRLVLVPKIFRMRASYRASLLLRERPLAMFYFPPKLYQSFRPG